MIRLGIRVLENKDLQFAADLTAEEGWFYTPRELEVMLRLDPEGSFVFEDEEQLGFVTTVTYGRTGVIGHLVVGRKGRGRKIGGSLLNKAIEYMESRGADSMLLYATKDAVKMYQKYGFVPKDDIYCVHLHLDDLHRKTKPSTCVPLTSSDMTDVASIDRMHFGDERIKLLSELLREGPQHAFKIERDGVIAGYIMARHDHDGYDLGPWACLTGDQHDAEDLWWSCLSTLESGTIYMGSFLRNESALKIIAKLPKVRSWTIPVMVRGRSRYSGDLSSLYGIAAFELG